MMYRLLKDQNISRKHIFMLVRQSWLYHTKANIILHTILDVIREGKFRWLGCHEKRTNAHGVVNYKVKGTIPGGKPRTSSSPSSYSHFYVGSMYDDIRLHVARSYTSSADSPFSLISSFTLSNHLLLLGLPLFLLPCTFISIALLPRPWITTSKMKDVMSQNLCQDRRAWRTFFVN